MTVLELNEISFIAANIRRVLQHIEEPDRKPDFFIPDTASELPPITEIFRAEIEDLMQEYRRRSGYIEQIREPWIKRIFELRFLERKTFQEISVEIGMLSGTLKQTVYSFLKQNPEGYISCIDLAEDWGVSVDTVENRCRSGQIPGAKKRQGSGSDGFQRWIIPVEVLQLKVIDKYQRKAKG